MNDGKHVKVIDSDLEMLVKDIKKSATNFNKDKVLAWLKKKEDPSISKSELNDFTATLNFP